MVPARMISIDPGFNTGWAYWERKTLIDFGSFNSVYAPHKDQYQFFPDMFRTFKFELFKSLKLRPTTVVIEKVNLWGGSMKSMASAKRGDLFQLAYLIGGYYQICSMKKFIFNIQLISVNEWKGQMPKIVVANRIRNKLGITLPNDHISDAVGIGLSILGEL